jgi:hypothetical protein
MLQPLAVLSVQEPQLRSHATQVGARYSLTLQSYAIVVNMKPKAKFIINENMLKLYYLLLIYYK